MCGPLLKLRAWCRRFAVSCLSCNSACLSSPHGGSSGPACERAQSCGCCLFQPRNIGSGRLHHIVACVTLRPRPTFPAGSTLSCWQQQDSLPTTAAPYPGPSDTVCGRHCVQVCAQYGLLSIHWTTWDRLTHLACTGESSILQASSRLAPAGQLHGRDAS